MFCPIQSATNQYLDRLEASQREFVEMWQSAREQVNPEDLIDDMQNEATGLVLACDKVERGLMSIEDLGWFVMARRNHVLDLLIKQQL